MLLQAVEIILEHCAVLQPELRREEQGGRGLHHAAKMKCVKAASKFGCSLLGVFRVSQSAFRNDRTFMNFCIRPFAELLLRGGQCWRRCVSGLCSREPRREELKQSRWLSHVARLAHCIEHASKHSKLIRFLDFQEHVSRQSVFVTWCDSAKECLVAESKGLEHFRTSKNTV